MTAPAPAPLSLTRDDGPAVEQELVRDMLKRALPVAPALILLASIPWGIAGGISTAYAVAIVLGNFALSAALLSWSARVSLGLLMGAALFGYLIRLGLIAGAVFAVRNAGWFEPWPLGLTLIVTHLGLLLWELRFVSASLAFPGLKPSPTKSTRKD